MQQGRLRLEGKVAIVTGAGSSGPGVGTGKAISILFVREGARVLLVDQISSRAEATLATIREEGGGQASVFEADVTKSEDCRAMVDASVERYGALHVLVNNAGILRAGNVVDIKEEHWDEVLDVNLKSMMLTSRYAVPKIAQAGGGSIINMSSGGGLRGAMDDSVAYSASKGGAVSLTNSMAVQHARENIRVNCIAPGSIYTPMVAAGMTEEMRVSRRKGSPLGTEGTGWDVAWAAVFLASDESRWISGVVLPVDAGRLVTTMVSYVEHLPQRR